VDASIGSASIAIGVLEFKASTTLKFTRRFHLADRPIYYACELTPDNDLRIYHSRLPLLDGLITEACHKGMFEDMSPFMELLMSIDGIAVAQIYMYKFYVRKSSIFTWQEIDVKIMELLRCIPLACGQEEPIHETRIADEWKQPAEPRSDGRPTGDGPVPTGA